MATLTVLLLFSWSGPASATWAVVSTDPATKDLGVAFASCLDAEILGEPETPLIPMVFVPGEGAAIYTDTVDTSIESEVVGLLSQGVSPAQILDNIDAFENESRARGQYSVVTVDGASAARSGSVAEGQVANGASFAVQGSDVAPSVVDGMQAAMEQAVGDSETQSRTLADRLVAALLAGSEAGGDLRCGEQAALFAQVVVVGEDDSAEEPGFILTVVVDDGDGQNPVTILAREHEGGSTGLLDVGAGQGRGVWVYAMAAILGAIMIVSGFVVFRFGIGNVAARR